MRDEVGWGEAKRSPSDEPEQPLGLRPSLPAAGPTRPGSEPSPPAPELVRQLNCPTNNDTPAAFSTARSHRTPEFFRSVAQLGIQAAEALEHAHQMGVVHRDIKPSNLMVDARAHLWITDFGLAQISAPSPLRGESRGEGASLTLTGDILGTLRYMSPEQAAGRSRVLDHHTDIYSLGLTLYELLTLRPAFEGDDRQHLVRQILEADPPPPRHVNQTIPKDLETIVLKATAKEPSHRYASAQQLADDLRRFLDDKPIGARRPSLVERAAKWARRHRAAVRAAVAVLVASLGALVTSMVLIAGAYESEKEQRGLAVQQKGEADRQKDEAVQQKEEAQRQRDSAEQNLYLAHVHLAWQDWRAGQVPRLYETLQKYLPQSDRRDLRGWEWYYLLSLCHQEQTILRDPAGYSVTCMAWNRKRSYLATGNNLGQIRIWDPAGAKHLFTLQGCPLGATRLAWTPDGDFLAATSLDDVRVWDIRSRAQTNRWPGRIRCRLAWSPDGKRLAYTGRYLGLRIRSVPEGKLLSTWPVENPESVAWSPDGKYLAAGEGANEHSIRIWDSQTGAQVHSWRPGGNDIFDLAWSPDGGRLASGTYSQELQVWETGTWRELLNIPHTSGIQAIAWSPDGRYLASGTRGAEAIVWDSRTGQRVNALRGHLDWVRSIGWSGDGERLATQSSDEVRIWDPKKTTDASSFEHPRAFSLGWSADGSRLATAGGGKVKIWDAPERRELASWDSAAKYCALHPDGKRLALKHIDKKVEVVDAATGKVELTLPCGDQRDGSSPLDWSPDGTTLAYAHGFDSITVDAPDSIIVHDIARNKNIATLRGHTKLVWVVRFSPDGKRLASAGWDGTVRVWDPATGESLVTFQGHPGSRWLAGLAWSPDGNRLASAGWDQKIEVWDAGTGKGVASLRGHTSSVFGGLDWSPDGKRLASASADGTVKLWNTETWEEVLSMETGGASRVRWGPNGKQLAVVHRAGLKIWDAAPAYQFAQSPAYRLERADVLARSGRLDEAKRFLEKWIAEYPREQAYRDTLSAIRFDEGHTQLEAVHPQRAVAAFNEVLRLQPSVAAYFQRALVREIMREFDKAAADYSDAIRLDPKNARAYVMRGQAYSHKHDFASAIADFEKAVELQPDDPRNCNELAWLLVTCPDRRMWDPARAVELAKKLTQGGGAYEWNTLGVAHYRAGDHEAAIQALGKSMELGSGGVACDWFFVAMAHWQLKHTEEARRWYDKGAAWMEKQKSNDEELLRFRAEAAELLGVPLKPPAAKEKTEPKPKAESGKLTPDS